MKKIAFLLVLFLSIAFFSPISVKATDKDYLNFIGWTEVAKFDYLSAIIDGEIADGIISYRELKQILKPIDISEFNKETGSSYSSNTDLAKEIYSQIDKYLKSKESSSIQMMAVTSVVIVEGGLNYSVEGWNYYGVFMDNNNTNAFAHELGHVKEKGTLAGGITALMLAGLAPIASAAIAVVTTWNVYTIGNVLNDITYYSYQNPYGLYISRNKFTNSYVVRKQVPGRVVTAGAFGGGGGGHW